MALSGEQELILDCLCERSPQTSAQVARYARLPKPETIAMLEHLADQGYVERERSRGIWHYSITAAVRRAAITPNPAVWTA